MEGGLCVFILFWLHSFCFNLFFCYCCLYVCLFVMGFLQSCQFWKELASVTCMAGVQVWTLISTAVISEMALWDWAG